VKKKRAYAGLASAVLGAALVSVAIPTAQGAVTNCPAGETCPTTNEDMSWSLYNLSGGRITAGFDGYSNPDWAHEGIDIARAYGSPVRALIGGTITNVSYSSSPYTLSTIAIYNATFDKTIVYLHTNPVAGLGAGQSISRDQKIGTEADRGAPGAIHTHVEMRLGWKTLAATSKDRDLVNPNPTTFWQNRGYNIR
jgi:murein DD-endopeptidase MepM/ murein hydrolase activator NlpD